MSEFGDISRMDLSVLDRKDSHAEEDMDEVMDVEEAEASEAEADSAGLTVTGDAENAGDSDATAEPEVEVVDTKQRMAAPSGKHYYIDAEITPGVMRAFMFAHNYTSPLMILATLVGFIWPVYTVFKQEGSVMFAVVCAAVFLILMPASIWYRATASVTKNPIYENTFHYMLDEAGIHLELEDKAMDLDWKEVTRKMFLPSTVAVYTGKINAYLIPTAAMGDKKDEIIQFIKDHTR